MATRPPSRRTPRPMGIATRSASSRRPVNESVGWGRSAIALLPLACVALGGGVERWSQALVLLTLGGVLLTAPPRASLGRGVNIVLVVLLALGLTAFLPAAWFGLPAWRRAFVDDFGVSLPGTVSAQPWLSAESWIVFLAGVCWFYLMATLRWQPGERRRAGIVFAVGVAVMAAAFVALSKLGVVIPIWKNPRHFGSFPNRNQTADFLAVGALPLLALARAAWRAGTVRRAVGWLAGWLAAAVAVFQCFSRAGIAILFITSGFYLGLEYLRAARRRAPTHDEAKFAPWRRAALLFSLVLVATSVFLAVGGDTLERLRPGSAYSDSNNVSNELRLRIQADTLDVIAASPWTGVGLGNFGSLFEVYRRQSASAPLRSVHPESDWLWLAAEMGWPSLVVALVGCVLVGRRMWPGQQSHDRPLRTAAALGVAAFLLHGLVDVSAHRLGTAMCGLFLLGMALPGETEAPTSPRLTALFRVLGLGFITVGIAWTLAARGALLLPGAQGVARLKSTALGQGLAHDFVDAQETVTRALAWAPLDWELYFIRAGAGVYRRSDLETTAMDFRRARFLERCSPSAPMDEARLWAAVGQDPQAVSALLEACRRAPARPGDFIGPIYLLRPGDAEFVDLLGTAVLRRPALAVAFAERIEDPEAAADFIARFREADPDLAWLDDGQRVRFFRAWALRGDPQTLASAMSAHPAWQIIGWRWWAEGCARGATPEAWEQASKIAAQNAPAPDVPTIHDARPLAQLKRDASAVSDDPALTLALFRAQQNAGDFQGGLNTLRKVARRADLPPYFNYLEAQAAADAGEWQTAWEAWRRYLESISGMR